MTEIIERRRRTAAERKRDQRLRAAIDAGNGEVGFTAESMATSILDALAIMLREGDRHGQAEAIFRNAATGFRAPRPAQWEMKRRLSTGIPKLLREG
ncbi:hypothetical protein [Dongia sp.]|uniref:hypothetical protein n=1 Tax=Dongia sp. TaxID=1977262 RepID=UPI0035B23E9D